MKRVADFLFISNLTADGISPPWLETELRRCLASSLLVSCRSMLQSIGLFIDNLETKAEGKGENSFFALSNDSKFSCWEVIPKAPETWAPAWIVHPQYRNAELIDVGLFGSITRKQPNFCGLEKAEDPLWETHNQQRKLQFCVKGMIMLKCCLLLPPAFDPRHPIFLNSFSHWNKICCHFLTRPHPQVSVEKEQSICQVQFSQPRCGDISSTI